MLLCHQNGKFYKQILHLATTSFIFTTEYQITDNHVHLDPQLTQQSFVFFLVTYRSGFLCLLVFLHQYIEHLQSLNVTGPAKLMRWPYYKKKYTLMIL